MIKRKAIGKKARFEIFKRDGFTCQYCGAVPPKVILHVDHIVPVSAGGGNEDDNLVTSCDGCNLGKGARSLDQVPASLASRAAEVAEREEQLLGFTKIMLAKRERLDSEAWDVAEVYVEQFRSNGIRKDWFQSIKNFIEKLGVVTVLDAMDIAISRKPYSGNTAFRYFCGICWAKIREISE
jgi:DNA-directed RNA polymerase subunit RPC12/RpoP